MLIRKLLGEIQAKLGKGKALVIIGPRQVGKTTLIREIVRGEDFLFLDGDDPVVRELLNTPNTEQIRSIIANNKIVFVDEAQRIENIGLTLKIITDQFKDVQLLVSGSSAFELMSKTSEPLTGRKFLYHLYPISWAELEESVGFLKAKQQLEIRLLYGMYPEVINHAGNEYEILKELAGSYLYKDVLGISGIRKPELLEKLLQALAYQIGNEVRYNELSKLLGVDKNTVNTYIDLLEQCFVVFRLQSFSKNLRSEIKANRKIYFYDTGIRNMVIGNFNPLNTRTDKGAIWENFLIAERMKKHEYAGKNINSYFWRTVQQQEIDYVEVANGKIKGFEFKYAADKRKKTPASFENAYETKVETIDTGNFRDFVM